MLPKTVELSHAKLLQTPVSVVLAVFFNFPFKPKISLVAAGVTVDNPH